MIFRVAIKRYKKSQYNNTLIKCKSKLNSPRNGDYLMIDIDYGIELKILFMSVGGLVCIVGIELKTLFMSVGGLL